MDVLRERIRVQHQLPRTGLAVHGVHRTRIGQPRGARALAGARDAERAGRHRLRSVRSGIRHGPMFAPSMLLDRKSTRLNSSHVAISYAVFCLKKKRYAL